MIKLKENEKQQKKKAIVFQIHDRLLKLRSESPRVFVPA